MYQTIKVCKIHGDLRSHDVLSKNRCKWCNREKERVYREKNPEKILARRLRYEEKIINLKKENGSYRPRGEIIPKGEIQLKKTCSKHGELAESNIAIREGKYLRCKLCAYERNRSWESRNPDKVKIQKRSTYLRHISRYNKEAILRNHKNITREEYQSLLDSHNDKCGICNRPESRIVRQDGSRSPLSIDHDHATGKVRGLLCNKCNRALGMFEDSIASLQSAINYLKRHSNDSDN